MSPRGVARVSRVWLFGTCLLLFLLVSASPAAAGFPCEDVDNNGLFIDADTVMQ